MGSVVSVPTAIAVSLIAGSIAYGFVQSHPSPPQPVAKVEPRAESSGGKKGKKKKGAQAESAGTSSTAEKASATPIVVPFPPVVPGDFESEAKAQAPAPAKPKAKKKKAKKAVSATGTSAVRSDDAQSESSATAPESSTPVPRPKRKSPPVLENDGPWTRVESRKKRPQQQPAALSTAQAPEPPTSDPGITTSVTGTSEHTEDEQRGEQASGREPENRRTLAERLLPKPRKTKIEDMLETPDVPPLARVMRVTPRPDERPAAGFSWGDYEDVEEARVTADDADGEDESGWIVKSSNRKPKSKVSPTQAVSQSAPETLTKKQRQNRAKREAEKAADAEKEAERLAALAAHKRELEKARIAEQYAHSKKPGGGQRAAVSGGHLVFE